MIKTNFNSEWNFAKGGAGALSALLGGSVEPIKVTLPHDASICSERDKEDKEGSGNGFFREENCNYSKDFIVAAEDADKVIWIEFEGVYQNSFVYINNAFAGKCPYGYGNYFIDATKFIKFGESNHIQVIVKNGVASGRWYTGGGIYRDVNLMISDRLHLIPKGIHISARDIEEGSAVIRVESVVEYNGTGTRDMVLVIEVLNHEGKVVAANEMPATIFEHSKVTLRQQFIIEDPHLWDVEDPYLYTYHSYIKADDRVTDEETGTFGIRKLQLDVKHGLRINGKTVNLRGGCIHHDNGVLGTATFAHAEENRVKKLKEAGFNAIRSAHHPMGKKLLEACDRLGMLVMDELSDVWVTTKVDFDYGMNFAEWWEHDITNMVDKDYNHPCVIMYSIGNEIPQTGNKIDNAWGKKLADKIRKLDDTRYTTNSVNLMLSVMDRIKEFMALQQSGMQEQGAANTDQPAEINTMMNNMFQAMQALTVSDLASDATQEAFAQVDIAGYNYADNRYISDGVKYPNRIIVGSETYPAAIDGNWDLVEKLPYVIGDFTWTSWDYLGETGIGGFSYGVPDPATQFYKPYPWKAAYCGDFNLIGQRRPVSYWREIIWGLRKAPYIAVSPPVNFGEKINLSMWGFTDAIHSWNWSGYEGKPVSVEVYSDSEEVELFINGKSMGRKSVGEQKKAIVKFETVYESGKIEAVAYKAGIETGRDLLVTADSNVEIEAISDKKSIRVGSQDVCYVEIALKDANNNLNMEANKLVSIQLEGPGIMQGFGSADPISSENYFDHTAKTFEGRLLAVVRSTDVPGEIKVILSAEGCKDVTVVIESK
ncbi:MAG: glycoside hydrolase [Herbinix sp.]|jgi:beta-galactosidase|nr:glycoside hydrolase [Herbinix sp.]